MTTHIGFGYDVHAFADDSPLVIGGVTLPFERGLAGHSDADVLIHAVIDALLGAAALGDIGAYFPSSEERWKDQPSTVFLEAVWKLISQEHGWSIVNIDATIVAERPKIAPYIARMRRNLAEQLGVNDTQVSVKATTTDRLGFTGREEGIACYSVVLLEQDR